MPRARVNGIDAYYEIHGTGAPVVFVTGVGLDHTAWSAQTEPIGREYQCIVFDSRGIGQSGDSDEEYTVERMAGDTLGLMDALGVQSAHVVGASLGGCVGLEMALVQPGRLRSLAVHGTRHQCWPHTRLRFEIQIALNRRDPQLAAAFSVLAFYGAEYVNENEGRVRAEIGRRAERIRNGLYPVAMAERQYRAGMSYDVSRRPGEISVPTLVGVGTSDELAPPAYARAISRAIPGSEMVEFPGAPHMVNMFMPDMFNEISFRFLRRHT